MWQVNRAVWPSYPLVPVKMSSGGQLSRGLVRQQAKAPAVKTGKRSWRMWEESSCPQPATRLSRPCLHLYAQRHLFLLRATLGLYPCTPHLLRSPEECVLSREAQAQRGAGVCPRAHGKVLTGPRCGPCPQVSTDLQDERKLLPWGQGVRAVPAQPSPDLAPEL